MSKKSPLAPDELPLLEQPEAITLLLEGVLATSFTFADPQASHEVRMLDALRHDLLGAVDVWPRLGEEERKSVTEALAEHLERLEDAGWALSGERHASEDGTVLRFHALRQPPRYAAARGKRHGVSAPRGLLH